MRDAAQDLAQQANRAPGKARVVFKTVADITLIGTAVLSGALAAVTLWKALFHRHQEHPEGHASGRDAGKGSPPHRGNRPPVSVSDDNDAWGRHHSGHHDQARSR